jgi:hypothetical protein
MRVDPVPEQGGWSYRKIRRHLRNGFRLGVSFGRRGLDADTRSLEGPSASRHGHSPVEVSKHLAAKPPARPDAVSASVEMGLLARGRGTVQGEAESLPPDFPRRNYSLRLPFRDGGRRYSGRQLRVGVVRLRAQPVRGERSISTNADSLAGKL